jgi:small conductance mechanosensitive channel
MDLANVLERARTMLVAATAKGAIPVVAAELLALTLLAISLYLLAARIVRALPWLAERASSERMTTVVRSRLSAGWALVALLILGYNAWLVARGVDVREHTLRLLAELARPEVLQSVSVVAGKLLLGAIAVVLLARLARLLLAHAEAAINRWDGIRDNDKSLSALFAGLKRSVATAGTLLWLVLGGQLLGVPADVQSVLELVLRIYLILAVGFAIVRSGKVVVDTLAGYGEQAAERRGLEHYVEIVRPLVPTLRTALEYVLWLVMASLVLEQIDAFAWLADWGPRLIQAIGVFLLGRVALALGLYEIGRRLLPEAGLTEVQRRRRATTVPLARSVFTYAAYFSIAVVVLAILGFNPIPFLAGAGILGLVVGFGAQSLINDVVSGFFILFENVYLVGDVIQTGDAAGVVEAIEFRTTKIRGEDGRLHIIRNGDLGRVINFSREYATALVTFDVPHGSDLPRTLDLLQNVSARVCERHPDVLASTVVEGITNFGESGLTVRMKTKTRPGRNVGFAAQLKLAIREAFDREAGSTPRAGLVPLHGHALQAAAPSLMAA